MDDQTYERIRARAFELFQERSREGSPGDPQSDWLRAEGEILAEKTRPSAAAAAANAPTAGRPPVRQARERSKVPL